MCGRFPSLSYFGFLVSVKALLELFERELSDMLPLSVHACEVTVSHPPLTLKRNPSLFKLILFSCLFRGTLSSKLFVSVMILQENVLLGLYVFCQCALECHIIIALIKHLFTSMNTAHCSTKEGKRRVCVVLERLEQGVKWSWAFYKGFAFLKIWMKTRAHSMSLRCKHPYTHKEITEAKIQV